MIYIFFTNSLVSFEQQNSINSNNIYFLNTNINNSIILIPNSLIYYLEIYYTQLYQLMGGSSSKIHPQYEREKYSHQVTRQRLLFQQQKFASAKQQLIQVKKQLKQAKDDLRILRVQLKTKSDKIKQLQQQIHSLKHSNLQLAFKAKKYKSKLNQPQPSFISKSKITSRSSNNQYEQSLDSQFQPQRIKKYSNKILKQQSQFFASFNKQQQIQEQAQQDGSRFDTPNNSKIQKKNQNKSKNQQTKFTKKRTQTQGLQLLKKNTQKSLSSLKQSSMNGDQFQFQLNDSLSVNLRRVSYGVNKTKVPEEEQAKLFNSMGKVYYKNKNCNLNSKQHWSSGFIVQIDQVMTCASFFFEEGKLITPQEYDVRFYPHFLSKDNKYINVKQIHIHSDFKDTGKPIQKRFNDVAIVQLVMQNSMKNSNYLKICSQYSPQLFEYVSIIGYAGNENSNGPQKYFLSSSQVQLKKIQTKVKFISVYNNKTGEHKQVDKRKLVSYIEDEKYSVAINYDLLNNKVNGEQTHDSLFDAQQKGESLVSLKGTPILVQVQIKNKWVYLLAGINEGVIGSKKNIAILLSKNLLSHTLPYKDNFIGSQ